MEDIPQKTTDKEMEKLGYKKYKLVDRYEAGGSLYFKYTGTKNGEEWVVSMTYDFSPKEGWHQFTLAELPSSWY